MKNKKSYIGLFGAFVVVAAVLGVVWVSRGREVAGNVSQQSRLAMAAPTLPVPKLAAKTDALPSSPEIVFVPRIVDGDTIMVESVDPSTGAPLGKPQSVRYIGMDTPETVSPTKPVECYGHEASDRNRALVAGKYVAIVRDASDRDKYGRLLRFVYLLNDASSTAATGVSAWVSLGTMVDLELVREGYARVLTIPPDMEHEDEFKAAASMAKSAKLGFWGACAAYPFVD